MQQRAETDRIEPPCIWVLAGVLAYRPCDRAYDCEGCELFHALQGGPRSLLVDREPAQGQSHRSPALASRHGVDELVNAQLARLLAGCELHLDRAYSPSHLWLRPIERDLVELGLDLHTSRVLNPVDDITLPHLGVLLKLDEPCGWITRGRMAIPLHAPLSGTIEAINDECLSRAGSGRPSAEAEGWLMRVRSRDDVDHLPGLYRGERALRWYLAKVELVKQSLRHAMFSAMALGSTQADGGTLSMDLQEVLGTEAFETLVDHLFHLQI